MAALTSLAADATKVRGDIKSRGVCAVGSAQAELGASEGLAAVSAALAKMAAAGYPTTFAVPQTPKQQSRSLDNGTLVREGGCAARACSRSTTAAGGTRSSRSR